jgi:hypothetical protein
MKTEWKGKLFVGILGQAPRGSYCLKTGTDVFFDIQHPKHPKSSNVVLVRRPIKIILK